MLFSAIPFFLALVSAAPPNFTPHPYRVHARSAGADNSTLGNSSSLVVDLGYSIYEGYTNESANLNILAAFCTASTGGSKGLLAEVDIRDYLKGKEGSDISDSSIGMTRESVPFFPLHRLPACTT